MNTKSDSWKSARLKFFYLFSLVVFTALCSSIAPVESAYGNPAGGIVINGSASIKNSGNILTINQGTDRLILGWNSFSIAPGETTRFIQPSSSSMALNRVFGGTRSMIEGNLEANGGVILINPDGITVTKSGVVNVNTFIGSTHGITDSEFLSGGSLNFKGASDASVENFGTIHAESGDIILIARNLRNSGNLIAPKGTVALGGADEVLYQPALDEKRLIKSSGAVRGAIHSGGLIQAAAAEIKAAGNPYAVAINLDGVIQARGDASRGVKAKVLVQSKEGGIKMRYSAKIESGDDLAGGLVLVQAADLLDIAGKIEATSSRGTGGEIRLLGNDIHLADTAIADASGALGGGKLLIGGDYQGGKDPSTHYSTETLQNASTLRVDQGALLSANATISGNGGSVIQWSDLTTISDGAVSVHGGSLAGNGGFAEISGKHNLEFNGSLDLAAPKGRAGMVLFDPEDLYVSDNPSPGLPATGTYLLNSSAINAITSGTVSLSGANITLSDPAGFSFANIALQPDVSLQLNASSGNLIIPSGSSVTSSAEGSVQLHAFQNLNFGGVIVSENGSIQLSAGNGNLNLGPGSSIRQSSGGISLMADQGSILGSSAISSISGGISVIANDTHEGNIDLSGLISTGNAGGSGGKVNFVSGNDITFNGTLNAYGGSISLNAGRGITLGNVLPTTVTTSDTLNLESSLLSLKNTPVLSVDSISGSFGSLNTSALQVNSQGVFSKVYDGTRRAFMSAENLSFNAPNETSANPMHIVSVNASYNTPDV